MSKPILQHLHLPGLTSYSHALQLQSTLVSRILDFKRSLSSENKNPPSPPPPPTILTFSPYPVYTHGRRDPKPPSEKQLSLLLQPLQTQKHGNFTPTFSNDSRGGQTTFHGPGQLVIWPIFTLDRPYSFRQHPSQTQPQPQTSPVPQSCTADTKFRSLPRLSPTSYVCLLEATTIATLSHYSLPSRRTSDPGVWTTSGERKIAAVGVHLRRNVASFGVGLNVDTDARWWERIVACGLAGKGVSSMEGEGVDFGDRGNGSEETIEEVAGVWVGEFARNVAVSVRRVREKEMLKAGL